MAFNNWLSLWVDKSIIADCVSVSSVVAIGFGDVCIFVDIVVVESGVVLFSVDIVVVKLSIDDVSVDVVDGVTVVFETE